MNKLGYRAELTGLRTLAVYLVLLFHAGVAGFDGGFVGVDVFFVLSGFLVTTVLLSERMQTGRIAIGAFYARRVRRLLPAALLVIVSTAVLFAAVTSVVRRVGMEESARSALLYYANWQFLADSKDYFAESAASTSPFLHFWSLSIEEQFYIAFPLLLLGVIALIGRLRPASLRRTAFPSGLSSAQLRGLALTFAVLLAGSLALQMWLAQGDVLRAYYGTDTRLYQLLAGALLAIVWGYLLPTRPTETTGGPPSGAPTAARRAWTSLRGTASAWLGLALVLAASCLPDGLSISDRGIVATVGSVFLIAGLLASPTSPLARFFALGPNAYLGGISYATYLWHWPVLLLLREIVDVDPWVMAALVFAIATGLAALSAELIELPLRKGQREKPKVGLSLALGLSSTVVMAGLVIPPIADQTKPLVLAGNSAAATNSEVLPLPEDVEAALPLADRPPVEDELDPNLDLQEVARDIAPLVSCTIADPEACFVVRNDGPTMVLVGDSHAQMFIPMFAKLAEQRGFSLAVNVSPGCTWQAGIVNPHRPVEDQAYCSSIRGDWYESVLPQLEPDVMMLISMAYDWQTTDPDRLLPDDGRDESLTRLLHRTTVETLNIFQDQGLKSIVLQDTIRSRFDPLDCLAVNQRTDTCRVPVETRVVPSDGYYLAQAAYRPEVDTVDFDPVLCPHAPVCEPVLDGTVVWRDVSHTTTEIGVKYADDFWELLAKTKVFGQLGWGD